MTHFNEFKDANPTISNHVLAQTLKYMEEQELITKTVVDEHHNKTEYALTPNFNYSLLYEDIKKCMDENLVTDLKNSGIKIVDMAVNNLTSPPAHTPKYHRTYEKRYTNSIEQ